jgi:hypothetical protein
MTLERYQLKAFRECWFIFDDKMNVYAGFKSWDMMVKAKKHLDDGDARFQDLKWCSYAEMIA